MTEQIQGIWLPAALRYGVPYELFWDLSPRTLEVWQRNYNFAMQEEADKQDAFAWSLGTYVLQAIAAAFDGKKSPYPKEPRYIASLREEKEENAAAADAFWAWAVAFNKKNGLSSENT